MITVHYPGGFRAPKIVNSWSASLTGSLMFCLPCLQSALVATSTQRATLSRCHCSDCWEKRTASFCSKSAVPRRNKERQNKWLNWDNFEGMSKFSCWSATRRKAAFHHCYCKHAGNIIMTKCPLSFTLYKVITGLMRVNTMIISVIKYLCNVISFPRCSDLFPTYTKQTKIKPTLSHSVWSITTHMYWDSCSEDFRLIDSARLFFRLFFWNQYSPQFLRWPQSQSGPTKKKDPCSPSLI